LGRSGQVILLSGDPLDQGGEFSVCAVVSYGTAAVLVELGIIQEKSSSVSTHNTNFTARHIKGQSHILGSMTDRLRRPAILQASTIKPRPAVASSTGGTGRGFM
jgi:hypothetical protein